MNKDSLTQTLKENWPPSRVLIKCKECDRGLFDSEEMHIAEWKPSFLASTIVMISSNHARATSHFGIDIAIDTTAVVEEIDCTITIGDQ